MYSFLVFLFEWEEKRFEKEKDGARSILFRDTACNEQNELINRWDKRYTKNIV